MSVEKSPKALRILQIIAGLIAIGLSVFVIVSSPNAAASFLETILAITLLVIGLERIGIGIIAKPMASRTRWASIGLGVLAVILAIVAILYPGSTIAVILLILAVALLIIGIIRVLSGVTYKGTSRFSKSGMIGVGVSIIVAIMIIASPLFGFFLVSLILGVTLLLNGIESIISGVTGKIERRLSKY
ncbi:MAG: DUF308 domain-containing protein [Nitrososphaeraceae archaeon]